MNSSNVTDIESLEDLNRALIRFTDQLRIIAEELKANLHKADDAYSHEYPSYWKRQILKAEQRLNEAKDQLAAKRSSTRPEDAPAATEEQMRVRKAEARLRSCNEKFQRSREWSLKISRECEQLLGPLSDVLDQCDTVLPSAASELRTLISSLKAYTDRTS